MIEVSKDGGVLAIRLNRPAKKNALTSAMYLSLVAAFDDANRDPAIRVISMASEGDTYCAGNDIADFLANAQGDGESSPPMKYIRAMIANDKPVIAAVHGPAVGIGVTMLLHFDFIYASERSTFSTPFVNLALVPEAASSLLLPARIGTAAATEMLMLGTIVDAQRAAAIGLVNQIVPAGELGAFVEARAKELAQKPPSALQATRALVRGDRAAISARAEAEGRDFAKALGSAEAREAFMAFTERRPPDFSKP